MTAPVASTVILPDDSGNTGKKYRTQTKTVGVTTVHEPFFVPSPGYSVVGKHFFGSNAQTVLATAQNATATGFYWFQLPLTATVNAVLRRINVQHSAGSALATPTAPVISFSKFTFTGTASGATEASLPYVTGGVAAQLIARTAVTGMTVTVVAPMAKAIVPAAETGVGVYFGHSEIMPANPLAFQRGFALELTAGEGLVVYQSVNGTTSDTRSFLFNMEWQEIDLT